MENFLLKHYCEETGEYEFVIDSDGIDLLFDISSSKLLSLCALSRTRPNQRNAFPKPVKVVGKNHWFLREVRHWQLAEARYYQQQCIDRSIAYNVLRRVLGDSTDGFTYASPAFHDGMDLWEKMCSSDAKKFADCFTIRQMKETGIPID